MPLESCMIILDCSEYMRNGDYIPTRMGAQIDAANLLVSAKTNSHPESTVGVSAGTQLLVSPTEDVGRILGALHDLQSSQSNNSTSPSSSLNKEDLITSAVQVASLALKHRRNKNGSQRIVLFAGTPLTQTETRALQKAGRQLKKNNVGIDVVTLGELDANEEKLKELVEAANGRGDEERTCHLVTIPTGVLPSDVLASSPVLAGGAFAASAAAGFAGGGGNEGGGAGNFADYGGVDPNMDPELAMALRVSMEEERLRQERVAAAAAETQPSTGDAEMTDAETAQPSAGEMGLSEEEALLQQALAMSMNENEPDLNATALTSAEDVPMDDEDDAAMQIALQMSMQADEPAATDDNPGEFQDAAFVNELLASMPGVDPNDPAIQAALRKAQDKKKDEKDVDKK
jgi:26S proteasome regulatory subunit N10